MTTHSFDIRFFWALFGGPQSFFVLCQYHNDANNRDVKEKK